MEWRQLEKVSPPASSVKHQKSDFQIIEGSETGFAILQRKDPGFISVEGKPAEQLPVQV